MNLARIPVLLFAAALYAQPTVEVATVVSKLVERKVRLPGEFLPYLKVDLIARVNGFVEKVEVDRGSVVKQGQLLVLLSAPELAAQRVEAEAKAQTIESQRAEAQARLVAAESTFERLKAASATPGAVAGNEVIQAEKAVDAARALVLAQASSAKAAQAAIEALRELESYLKLKASFDGVVTDRFVHPGALAGPAAGPVLRLEQNTRLRLVVAVPEADAAGIVPGARVAFHVPAFPGESFWGVVARIAHSVDPKTRSMAVELDVANPDMRLAPGMYSDVEWPVRRPRPSLLVPASSVASTTDRTFVIRVRDGRAEWVNVSRGATLGESVEVFGPLNAGDEVVRRASDEIREGAPLQVRAAGR